jgi:hypothetical protein
MYAGEPDKMNALVRAQKMLEPLAKQTGPASSAKPAGDDYGSLWKVVEVALKGMYGILKGGGMVRTMKLATSFGADDAAQAQRLVTRMMFDRELATTS